MHVLWNKITNRMFFFCTQKAKNAKSLKCMLWITELVNGEWGSRRTFASDSWTKPSIRKSIRSKSLFPSVIWSVLVAMKVKVIGLRKYICIFRNSEREDR